MRITDSVRIGGAVAAAWLLAWSHPISAAEKAPASIVSPKRDEVVEPMQEVVGRISIPGQPVVLIRPDVPGGEWYPQPPVEPNDRGLFKAKLRFGNDKTASGTKFHIAIVVLTSDEEVDIFRGKESLAVVPESVAHSEVIPVVLGKATTAKAADKTPAVGAVTYPTPDAKVKTVTEVTGKMTSEGWPVVIVRCDNQNDEWWVQGQAKFGEEGAFTSTARFGNEKTPSGTKFRVAVLTFSSAKAAERFVTGISFEGLPPGIPRSKEVLVTLERPEGKDGK
ncbi:MAG: hypothetical protein ACKVP0_22505 [Pirellulaceae bacterium]